MWRDVRKRERREGRAIKDKKEDGNKKRIRHTIGNEGKKNRNHEKSIRRKKRRNRRQIIKRLEKIEKEEE